jgi:hypothetical protein
MAQAGLSLAQDDGTAMIFNTIGDVAGTNRGA